MYRMLFPKSGCDYLSTVYFQKTPPFQRELVSKEGEQGLAKSVCAAVLPYLAGCLPSWLAKLSVLLCSSLLLQAAGLLVLGAGQGQGLAGPGGDKSEE